MAKSGRIIEKFAAASGLLPSTIDRILRSLRAKALVPTGRPGRLPANGRRVPVIPGMAVDHTASGHFRPSEIINVFLGLAAQDPVGAADAVYTLRYKVGVGSRIEHLTTYVDCRASNITMMVSLDPGFAQIRRDDEKTEIFGSYFAPGLQRLTLIPNSVFCVASELLHEWYDEQLPHHRP